MKRLAIIIITLATLALHTQAQSVRMGLMAAPQISWLTSDVSSVNYDATQIGFQFGMVTDLFFAERYSFSTGILINNTGGSLLYNDSLSFKASDELFELAKNTTVKYKLQYVDIPMTFKMESNKIGYFKYYAKFGAINHIRVGAAADIKNTEVDYAGVGCKDEVALFNMSYTIGGGTIYYFSKNTAVSVGVSYVNGFLDITTDSQESVNDKVTQRRVFLNIGFLF